MKFILSFIFSLVFCTSHTFVNAQSTLAPGDVSITGFNAGNGDIAFVSWVDLAPGTKINFTNNGWLSSATTTTANNARNLEEIAMWTNTTGATIAAGTTIVLTTVTPYTANYGSTTVFSNSGGTAPSLKIQDTDQITAYQTDGTGTGFSPDNSATATFSGTALCIVTWRFNWSTSGTITNATTYLPSDLAANSTFLSTTFLNPYLQYAGTRIGKTIQGYKTELQNIQTNWKNDWAAPMNSTAFALAVPSANLSNLSLSTGTLSPAFTSGTTTYTSSVSNATTSITVTPTAENTAATVTVNGAPVTSGSASDAIDLNVGDNQITVAVTAEDGTTVKTYTITVTRAADADLSGLAISQGTLSPVFAAASTEYTASVVNAVTSLTVTPQTSDPKATVTVNSTAVNSGSATPAIPLKIGANLITVAVTGQDGTTIKTYTVNVTRAIRKPSGPNMTRSTDLGIDRMDNITSNVTPVFVGIADPNATMILYDNDVQIGSGTADGSGNWTIRSSVLADGPHSIKVTASLNGLESTSNVLSAITDKVAPLINTITRLDPDTTTTSASTVSYRITFSEKVGGITEDNFIITASGTATGAVASVSSDIGTIIDVTVDNISGEGMLRLDVRTSSGIIDVAGNPETVGFTTGEEYTIVSLSTLPVTISDFNATQKGNAVEVTWKAFTEVNIEKYEIERSSTGTNFTKAGEISVKANAISNMYSWTDNHPGNGNNFYRLKTIDKDGTVKYSNIRTINLSAAAQFVKITPNPVANKTLKLILGNITMGKYELALYDNKGQRIFTNTILHDGGPSAKSIQLPSSLATGIYNLHISNATLKINKAITIK